MYIKHIQLQNFQVIENFEGDFTGNVYFVTGDNELGKSTLLKAIGALLTGNWDDVLKNGEEKGFAKMVIGDDGENYEVELRFTKANPRGKLSIKSQNTGMSSDNISMLQKIFGYQNFDAVEFLGWSESAEGRRKQIEVVKALLPEEIRKRIAEIDKETEKVKEERKGDNALVKSYDALIVAAQKQLNPGDIEKYKEPIHLDELMATQAKESQLIERAKIIQEKRVERQKTLDNIGQDIADENKEYTNNIDEVGLYYDRIEREYQATLKAAEKRRAEQFLEANIRKENFEKIHIENLKQIEAKKADCIEKIANADQFLAEFNKVNPNAEDTETRIKNAQEHNRIYSIVTNYISTKAEHKKAIQKVEIHEEHLKKLADERKELIAKAKLPIENLSFTDDGLELNGISFAIGKISDSQAMEVAAKLIICSNTKVKVFRIARGESLGKKRLESLITLAKKSGYQGFIEKVVWDQNQMAIEEYND